MPKHYLKRRNVPSPCPPEVTVARFAQKKTHGAPFPKAQEFFLLFP